MPLMRGARPTPRHLLAAATPYRTLPGVAVSPTVIPSQLSMWGNDKFGDCVSAEEAAAKAMYSVMLGLDELFIPEQDLINWARSNGFLNGADLSPVMSAMASPGIVVNGTTYTDGTPTSVNYADWDNLTSAISQGPVKIGIAADQLSATTAGQANGWYATGWTPDTNEDHCVGLWLFGTPDEIYDTLKLPVPSALTGTTLAEFLGLYTWSTVGCVDFQSVVNVCGEAWLRNATTPQESPNPQPQPEPSPTPTPTGLVIPLTSFWADPVSKQVHVPPGYVFDANYFNQDVGFNPAAKTGVAPASWKQV
jgi:hypothetical protein